MIKLLRIIRKDATAIYFTGGEPLFRKDIVEILKAAKEMGFSSITINTNMHLIDRRMEVLDYLTNLVASYDMSDNPTLQKEKGFSMTVNCVVTPQTIPQARKVLNFCLGHEIKFAVVPAELEDGQINQELQNSPEYQELINDLIKAKKKKKRIFGSTAFLKKIRTFERFDCYPTLTPHIYPNGDLFYPCQPLDTVAANLLKIGNYAKALQIGNKRAWTIANV
jgi:MoaA/NifB/PqqE/SkfB family radical SAM enzyme